MTILRSIIIFAFLLIIQKSFAFVLERDVDTGARWQNIPVTFQISENDVPSTILDISEFVAIKRAMESWSHIPGSFFKYQMLSEHASGDCEDAIAAQVNVICFINDRSRIQTITGDAVPLSQELIVTSGFSISGVTIFGAMILVNEDDHSFRTDSYESGDSTRFDLEAVILHELGHILGLDHSLNAGAVMHSNTSTVRSRELRVPHEDDIRGVQYLYPSNEILPGVSCGTINKHPIYLIIGIILLCLFSLIMRRKILFSLSHIDHSYF